MNKVFGSFESLEDRVLLAGNVNVAFDAVTGVLTITGDGAGNEIVINDDSGLGAPEIYGLNGTVITGEGDGQLPGGVTSIVINLGGGNDVLILDDNGTGLLTGQDATINMGAGNDIIRLEGDGDEIELGTVTIDLGSGNDLVEDNTETSAVQIENLTINGGAGSDVVRIDTGAFEVDNLSINMGRGNDVVALDGITGLTDPNVRNLNLTFGAGPDDLLLANVAADHTAIRLGGGRDNVLIDNSVFDISFSLRGNGGGDLVGVANSAFNGAVSFHGGAGRNFLFDLGGNTGVSPNDIRRFRIV